MAANSFTVNTIFKQYNVKNGLFNNQARCIVEMPDNRILVQTEGMFNLYDGYSFHPMEYRRSYVMEIQSFNNTGHYFDKYHRLWIRDYCNLYLIDTKNYHFLNPKNYLAKSEINNIENFFIDADGNAWILSVKGNLYYYDWENRARLVMALNHDGKSGNKVTVADILEFKDKYYVFLSDGQLKCYHKKTKHLIYTEQLVKTNIGVRLKAIAWGNHSFIYRGDHYLYLYNTNNHSSSAILADDNVYEFLRTRKGELWASSKNGIFHLDKKLRPISWMKDIQNQDGDVIKDSWLGITIDRQGGLWVCSFNNGVFYYNPQTLLLHNYVSSLSHPYTPIYDIKLYDDSHAYVSTASGLCIFNTNTLQFETINNQLSKTVGRNIDIDSNGTIWYSSFYDGLISYHPRSGSIEYYNSRNVKGLTDKFFFSKQIGKDEYLINFDGNKLCLFYPHERRCVFLYKKYPEISRFRTIVCACVIKDGYIIGTQNGFFFYNTHSKTLDFKRFSFLTNNEYSNKCNCLYYDHKDKIWIGTQNGLLLFDEKSKILRRFTVTDGLPNNCIQEIRQDKNGNYWISTSNGLVKMNIHKDVPSILSLKASDGLNNSDFNERASCITSKNILYFGTSRGLCEVNSQKIKFPVLNLKPSVMNISIQDNKLSSNGILKKENITDRLSDDNELSLNYNENFITLDISALNYAYPSHTIYRYRLEGIDNNWVTVNGGDGNISISYTSLPSGNYQFVAQAAMLGQSWGEPLKVQIYVAPPLWLSWWAYTIYTLLIVTIFVYIIRSYILFHNSKLEIERKERATHEREQLDEMKFRFFTNISHEFRTPLTLIIAPLQTILERTDIPQDISKTLTIIQKSAHALNSLVTQLLDFRSLENEGETLQVSMIPLDTLFSSIENTFRVLAEERNIQFKLDANSVKSCIFNLDVPKMQKIINNLLSNAFKFTPDGGSILFSVFIDEDQKLVMTVKDNGSGIKANDLEKIFKRFYQGETKAVNSPQNTGSGIGLNIVKGYVDLHHGSIDVDSKEGVGSTFTIKIPNNAGVEVNRYEHIDKIETVNEKEQIVKIEKHVADHQLKILVVEDNTDFRHFMVDFLSHNYQIMAASNGQEGLDMMKDYSPDLIISDVMMPLVDGFELCRAVKTNLKLSHIPIILLTAKVNDESRVIGYKSGADSYITKPFNMDVLLVRIKQLIEQREERKNNFNKDINVNPEDITISPIDEKFIKKAIEVVENNINNSEYSVVTFSSDMAMDRSNLYRKMQSLVGKSPLEFIRSMRMKRAAQLLKTGKYSIIEVSVMVGYNSTRIFSQNFKETFGVIPSQYK